MNAKAFVLMPLASEFDDIYEYLIRDAVGEAGFDVVRADDIRNQRNWPSPAFPDTTLSVSTLSQTHLG